MEEVHYYANLKMQSTWMIACTLYPHDIHMCRKHYMDLLLDAIHQDKYMMQFLEWLRVLSFESFADLLDRYYDSCMFHITYQSPEFKVSV